MVETPYKAGDTLSFGDALAAMKEGYSLTRNWNKADMSVQIQFPGKDSKMKHPYFYMDPGNGKLVPWFPSNLDLFAEDWQIAQ